MDLDLSGLKYWGKNLGFLGKSNNPKSTDAIKLISEHIKQTDDEINMYSQQFTSGQMSASDYKLAKLEASAKDLIYQLGVHSLYNTNNSSV